ncbi:sugar O-acetyltransferase [Anaerostipes sp.]|uniref:sugar O-acetyltransferase n=1 Tax=Anaerostipes sp. TaxID=1872530 RepID=UPI0025BFB304|nr:sugar O-acetyltransferase [Anaerostipes sp.]MBS7009324.1 sugar O-acetyltransferase [Anaerostipes sp.]
MTEKEKAALGMLYDANYDEDLKAERLECQTLCAEYNRLMPNEMEKRTKLMKKILGKTEGEFVIEQPFMCDYGSNIEIGERCYLNYNCIILDGAEVTFGHDVFVAPNCAFYTAGHPFNIEQRNAGLEYAYPIHVGNNVWIGGNVTVLPGVSIGDGTVVAAGSVVTKDLPEGVLAAGNPCRVIRKIGQE